MGDFMNNSTDIDVLKNDFTIALENFVNSTDDTPDDGRTDLYSAYEKIKKTITSEQSKEKDEKLEFMFKSLVTQMDTTSNSRVYSVLYALTFEDLLLEYLKDPIVKETLDYFVRFAPIKNLPLLFTLVRFHED